MRGQGTVLVDNYAFGINGVSAQHGWAVFLETIRATIFWTLERAGSLSPMPGPGRDLDSILGTS
jgi:hypothetical protein